MNQEEVKVIKVELLKHIDLMINSLDVCFDYLKPEDLKKTRELVLEMSSEGKFEGFERTLFDTLDKYEDKFIKITTKKVKTNEYLFMNEICILNIDFKVFESENKNTKKTIVQYLYNIYSTLRYLHGKGNLTKFIEENQKQNQQTTTLLSDMGKQIIIYKTWQPTQTILQVI